MFQNTTYCLKLSGMVPAAKRREFEQTFRFISNHLSPDCLESILSADIFVPDHYYFFSLWRTAESLTAFYSSQEFQVLQGAYKTLGTLESSSSGEMVESKNLHIKNNNN